MELFVRETSRSLAQMNVNCDWLFFSIWTSTLVRSAQEKNGSHHKSKWKTPGGAMHEWFYLDSLIPIFGFK